VEVGLENPTDASKWRPDRHAGDSVAGAV